MSDDIPRVRALPANPNLEHLRNEAKERLAVLRAAAPETQLAEAQFQVARDYGFASWRALKEHVERAHNELAAYTGYYRHDPAQVKNSYFHVTASDGHLMVDRTNGAKFEVTRQDDGRFASPGKTALYGFKAIEAGHAQVMTLDVAGRNARLARIDTAMAKTIEAANARAQEEQRRPRSAIILPPEVLERYVGHYASSFGLAMEITHRDGVLYVQASGQPLLPLSPEAETVFFYAVAPAQIHFQVEDGKTMGLVFHQNGVEQVMPRVSAEKAEEVGAQIAIRVEEQRKPRQLVSVPADSLGRFAGRYRLNDRMVITVTAEAGKLFAQATGQSRNEIFPESPTKFFFTVVAAQMEFFLDHKGHTSHAILHQNGQVMPLARLEDVAA